MSSWRLVYKEILYRKLDFILGVIAVCVAVGCLVAVMTLLRGHDLRINDLTSAQEEETLALMREVEDDYRKITKQLGYNILLVHKDQALADFFAQGYASVHMPEAFVTRLTSSEVMTVRHLLPTLHQRTTWPEQADTPIVLVGVRGEVLVVNETMKGPLLDPVERGTMRLGYALHEKLQIEAGDTVTFFGKEFEVDRVHAPRGNTDDITIWIHLEEAQAILNRQGEINAIMALSCKCGEGELDAIKAEVGRLLPETQVIQLAAQATARTQARVRAGALSRETTEEQQLYHARLRREREAFASWLVPLVIVGCIVWVGLLAFNNVRERTVEIGIWRALGLRSRQILSIFLAKAAFVGILGGVLGYGTGLLLGVAWGRWEGVGLSADKAVGLFNPVLLVSVLVLAPVLAGVASWIPAVVAAQQDPAVVLRED